MSSSAGICATSATRNVPNVSRGTVDARVGIVGGECTAADVQERPISMGCDDAEGFLCVSPAVAVPDKGDIRIPSGNANAIRNAPRKNRAFAREGRRTVRSSTSLERDPHMKPAIVGGTSARLRYFWNRPGARGSGSGLVRHCRRPADQRHARFASATMTSKASSCRRHRRSSAA